MLYVSEIVNEKPKEFENETQRMIYEALEELKIPFDRVENDFMISMEDCEAVNKKMNTRMAKNLFLCNRQKTEFYLFITKDNKHFNTKIFSKAMGISRVSFAPEETLTEYLGTKIGATTIFSLVYDKDCKVHLVIDKDVLEEKFHACNDGTNNAHIKITTKDLMEKYLKYTKHEPVIIEFKEEEE